MELRDELIKSGLGDIIKNGNGLRGLLGNTTDEGRYVNVDNPSTYIEVRTGKDFSLDFFGNKDGQERLLYSEEESTSKKDLNSFIKENFSNSDYIEWTNEIESLFPYDDVISDEPKDNNIAIETHENDLGITPLSLDEVDQREELLKDIVIENYQTDDNLDENEAPDVDENLLENPPEDEEISVDPYVSPSSLVDIGDEYKSMIDIGYIAPAINKEIKEDIESLRTENANIGKMFGGVVDTSDIYRFNHRDLPIDKLSAYISPDIKGEGISFVSVTQTINTDKTFVTNFNENIDGNRMYGMYCPVSIVSFEYRIKGEHTNRLDAYAVNDLGQVYGRIDAVSDKEHQFLARETDTLDFLDMASNDSVRKFSFMKNEGMEVDSESLEKLKSILAGRNDEMLDKISDRIIDHLSSDSIQGGYKALYDKMSDIEANIETYRDNSDFLKSRFDVDLLHRIDSLDSVGSEIIDTIKALRDTDHDTPEYKNLTAELASLKENYEHKLEEIKQAANSPDRIDLSKANENNTDSFEQASYIRQDFELKYEGLYDEDGTLRISDTSNSESRFVELIKKETVSSPVNAEIPAVNDKYNASAIEAKKEFVESWNQTDGNEKMQLHIKEQTGEIYTEYGTRVDRKSAVSDTKDEDGRDDYKVHFDEKESRYTMLELGEMGLAEGRYGIVDSKSENYQEFLAYKIDGDTAIGDISKKVYESVHEGIDQREFDNLDGNIEHIDNRLTSALEREGLHDVIEARDIIDKNDTKEAEIEKKTESSEERITVEREQSGDPEFDSPRTKYISRIGNPNADIEISDKKMAQIDKYLEKRENAIEETKAKLTELRDKISACDKILSGFEGKTEYFLMNSPAYQYTYMTMCNCISDYVKAGGKVGEDCYIKSDVSKVESTANNIAYLNALSHNAIGGILGTIVTDIQVKHAFNVDIERNTGVEKTQENHDIDKVPLKDRLSNLIDNAISALSEIAFNDIENIDEKNNDLENEKSDGVDRDNEDFKSDVEAKNEEIDREDKDTPDSKEESLDKLESDNGTDHIVPAEKEVDVNSSEKPELDANTNESLEDIEKQDESMDIETSKIDESSAIDDETADDADKKPEETAISDHEFEELDNKVTAAVSDDEDDPKVSIAKDSDASDSEDSPDNKEKDEDVTEQKQNDLADKIKDSLNGDRDDFKDVINDAIRDDELSPEDLMDQFSDVIIDYIGENVPDQEYFDESVTNDDGIPVIDDENIMDIGEKINIVAESLSQDTGINASDIRESIFNDFHESDSMSENVINAIDYATAQNSMDAEPTTLENLSYGDMDIDEIRSIQDENQLEPQINDIETSLDMTISSADLNNDIQDGVEASYIADIIKDKVGSNVDIPESSINDMVEQQMTNDLNNGVFDEPTFDLNDYIDACIDNVTDQIVNFDPDDVGNDVTNETDFVL